MDPRQLLATPFEKDVQYSQVSLSHNRNNSDTLCTMAFVSLTNVEVKITKFNESFAGETLSYRPLLP